MVAGRVTTGYTIERQSDVLKIEVIEDDIITAVTGAMGLAQRFNDQVAVTMKRAISAAPTVCSRIWADWLHRTSKDAYAFRHRTSECRAL
jgi:hypothetical protein